MWLDFIQLHSYQRLGILLLGVVGGSALLHVAIFSSLALDRKIARDALTNARAQAEVVHPIAAIKEPLPLPAETLSVLRWSGEREQMTVHLAGEVSELLHWLYSLQPSAWGANAFTFTSTADGLALTAQLSLRNQQKSSIKQIHQLAVPSIEVSEETTRITTAPAPPPPQPCVNIAEVSQPIRAIIHSSWGTQQPSSKLVLSPYYQRLAFSDFLTQLIQTAAPLKLNYSFKKPARLQIFEEDNHCLPVEFNLVPIPLSPVNWLP